MKFSFELVVQDNIPEFKLLFSNYFTKKEVPDILSHLDEEQHFDILNKLKKHNQMFVELKIFNIKEVSLQGFTTKCFTFDMVLKVNGVNTTIDILDVDEVRGHTIDSRVFPLKKPYNSDVEWMFLDW